MLRSLLFVPADSDRKLAKAKGVNADALVLDWEDGVAHERKPIARRQAVQMLQSRGSQSRLVLFRVHKVGSEDFRADCEALAGCLPDGLMLSKCSSADDVRELDHFLTGRDQETRCAIFPLIESAGGLINAYTIARSSERVEGLGFGAEDFSAEVGLRRSSEEIELLYARSALVTASRAAGCDAYDSPCLALADENKLAGAATRARNLGFTGKMAIHPAQIAILNAAFSPSEDELIWAKKVLSLDSSSGGVTSLNGQMIDEAVLRQARRIARLAAAVPSE